MEIIDLNSKNENCHNHLIDLDLTDKGNLT